jgi:ADP-heptose:LPS heptosyltransferase
LNLLFITSSRIGDAILTTGLLNHYIQKHPGIEITVASAPLTLPLFEGAPNVRRLISVVKQPYRRHWLDLWQQCRGEKWDIIVDMRGSLVSFFLKSGKRYVWKSPSGHNHRVVQMGDLIGATPAPSPYLWLRPEHEQKAASLIPDDLPVLAVSPAANWIGKQWPVTSFATLIKRFLKHQSARIAIFAAPHERDSIQPVLNAIPSHQLIDLVGSLSLLEIAACIKRCRAFVGNDSGLMHMSAAVGTPTLGLFGPSDHIVYGPYCPPENPINQIIRIPESREELLKRPDFAFDAPICFMESLAPDTVFKALDQMWEK